MSASFSSSDRRPGLDLLRAAAMLLGIPYHALELVHLHRRQVDDAAASVALWLVHGFRMPVFFAVSGFLAAVVIERKGTQTFLENRRRRVLLPLTHCLDEYHVKTWGKPEAISWQGFIASVPASLYENFVNKPSLNYLWFLEYLLLYSLALTLLERRLRLGQRAVKWHLAGVLPVLFLAQVAAMGLMRSGWAPGGASRALPLPGPFLLYATYFALGWLLRSVRPPEGALRTTLPWLWAPLLAGMLGYLGAARIREETFWSAERWLLSGAYSALFLSLVYAMLRACLAIELPARWRAPVAYLIDSSYWVYLSHLPILFVADFLLSAGGVPDALRVWVLTLVGGALSFGSYQLFVRGRRLGEFLTGRKAS